MAIEFKPIGYVKTESATIPRHWTVSDVHGEIVIHKAYQEGLRDIQKGQDIIVLFHFHQSREFTPDHLIQKPPHRAERLSVFCTCSPIRPNSIGMSVLRVIERKENVIYVKGLDMVNGTPVLDIKPLIGLKREREL